MKSVNDVVRRIAVQLGFRDAILSVAKAVYPRETRLVKQVRIGAVTYLVLANEDVGRRLVCLRRYEPWDSALLASLVEPEDICVDVGANTGYYTLLLASRAIRGQVHAFEPVKLNWHLTSAGALLNGFEHVVANNEAIGDQDGEMDFSEAVDGAYSSFMPVGRRAEFRKVRVRIHRLDSYVREHQLERIDVLKVDVEGAEGMVLHGATSLFESRSMHPKVAMLELYDPNLKPYGLTVHDVVSTMRGYGYEAFFAQEDGAMVPFGTDQYNVHQNVFFLDEVGRRRSRR